MGAGVRRASVPASTPLTATTALAGVLLGGWCLVGCGGTTTTPSGSSTSPPPPPLTSTVLRPADVHELCECVTLPGSAEIYAHTPPSAKAHAYSQYHENGQTLIIVSDASTFADAAMAQRTAQDLQSQLHMAGVTQQDAGLSFPATIGHFRAQSPDFGTEAEMGVLWVDQNVMCQLTVVATDEAPFTPSDGDLRSLAQRQHQHVLSYLSHK